MAEILPAPINVLPSTFFDGNDGPWSTFNLSIGNPMQQIRVLPSTLTSEVWAVGPQGCPDDGPFRNCEQLRGGTFTSSESDTWNAVRGDEIWSLGVESNLLPQDVFDGLGGNYGYDTIRIPFTEDISDTIDDQVVAVITDNTFAVGMIGLNERIPGGTERSSPGLLVSLNNSASIPSQSYSYTAGSNHDDRYGSLVLGGRDISRYEPNDVNFTMSQDSIRDLTVAIQAISLDGDSSSLLSEGVVMFIDSTLPNIWLPEEECNAWEDAFNLTYEATTTMYTISDVNHFQNLANNATITFTMGQEVEGGPTVDIVFPYEAFALDFRNPGNEDVTRYFPLRRAQTVNQQVLGRAFLQRAYLSVNYEWRNFSIYQVAEDTGDQPQIQPLPIWTLAAAQDEVPSSSTDPSGSSDGSGDGDGDGGGGGGGGGISGGAIAGIVIGVVAAVIILFGFCWWRGGLRRKREIQPSPMPPTPQPPMEGVAELRADHSVVYTDKNHPEGGYFAPQPGAKGQNDHGNMNELESPHVGSSNGGTPSAPRPHELAGHETSHELYQDNPPPVLSATMPHGPSPNLAPSRANGSPEPLPSSSNDYDHSQTFYYSAASSVPIQKTVSGARIVSHSRGNSQSPPSSGMNQMTPGAMGGGTNATDYGESSSQSHSHSYSNTTHGHTITTTTHTTTTSSSGLQRGGSHHSGESEGTLVNPPTEGGPSPEVRALRGDDEQGHGGMSAFVSPLIAASQFDGGRNRTQAAGQDRMVSPEPLTPP